MLLNPNSHILGLEASPIPFLAYSETFSLFSSRNGYIKRFMCCSWTESPATTFTLEPQKHSSRQWHQTWPKRKQIIWNPGLWLTELIWFGPMAIALLWAANPFDWSCLCVFARQRPGTTVFEVCVSLPFRKYGVCMVQNLLEWRRTERQTRTHTG